MRVKECPHVPACECSMHLHDVCGKMNSEEVSCSSLCV